MAYLNVGTDGSIRRANLEASRFLGYPLPELQAMGLVELHAPDSVAEAQRLFARLLRDGSIANEELTYRTRDGGTRYGLLSVSPVRGDDGAIVEARAVV